jgi:hypothetical protein
MLRCGVLCFCEFEVLKLYRTVGRCPAAWWQALLGCIQTRSGLDHTSIVGSALCAKVRSHSAQVQIHYFVLYDVKACFICNPTVWRRLHVLQLESMLRRCHDRRQRCYSRSLPAAALTEQTLHYCSFRVTYATQ